MKKKVACVNKTMVKLNRRGFALYCISGCLVKRVLGFLDGDCGHLGKKI